MNASATQSRTMRVATRAAAILAGMSLAGTALPGGQLLAQDAGAAAAAAVPAATPLPVAAPVDEFVKVDDAGMVEAPAPNLVDISDFTDPAANQKISLPKGPTISETQTGARVVEIDRPERFALDPADPESAWWEINPHFAFDRAQREQKPLMLLFTGDWNPQAMALSQEVFATKSFHDYVKEHLVICFLNYPRNITDAPDALRRIKDRFKVKGYPNVLLFNPNGEVERGIRGYRSGRPIDYFNQLVGACRPVLDSIQVRRQELLAMGFRDWSNYQGRLLFARFVERDGTHTVLQDASGQKWSVPINDLAPDDQRLVESFPAVAKVDLR